MLTRNPFPLRLAVGLALAIVLDTAVQISWKTAASAIPAATSFADSVAEGLRHPIFFVVGLLLTLQLVNWLKVLDHADLSYAQPITSLSYVSVCIFSAVYLHESIDLLQVIGISFVLAGVWFISRTDHAGGRRDGVSQ